LAVFSLTLCVPLFIIPNRLNYRRHNILGVKKQILV
jgi:hypothetical protein